MPEDFTQNWPLNWQRLHLNNLRWQKITFREGGCCNKCDSAVQLLGEISHLSTQRKVWFITEACISFWRFIISRLSAERLRRTDFSSSGWAGVEMLSSAQICFVYFRWLRKIKGSVWDFSLPPPSSRYPLQTSSNPPPSVHTSHPSRYTSWKVERKR